MVDFSLKDRVALITGASRGIGEAIATTLSANGARCVLIGRKIDPLQAVALGLGKLLSDPRTLAAVEVTPKSI